MANHTQQKTSRGGAFFAALFLVFSVLMFSQIGAQTKFSPSGSLFSQPRFWPALSVVGMVVFGAFHLLFTFREKQVGVAKELLVWVRAFEYFLWFMAYVWAVPIIGYLPATILFFGLLAIRQNYRSLRHLLIATLSAIAIVVIFKAGLSVKIPGGLVYEYLPDGVRSFMILNF